MARSHVTPVAIPERKVVEEPQTISTNNPQTPQSDVVNKAALANNNQYTDETDDDNFFDDFFSDE